jgi:hypothetical protein
MRHNNLTFSLFLILSLYVHLGRIFFKPINLIGKKNFRFMPLKAAFKWCYLQHCQIYGDTTFSVTTISVTTLSIMTISITTLCMIIFSTIINKAWHSLMTLSICIMKLCINDTLNNASQHDDTQHKGRALLGWCLMLSFTYAERHMYALYGECQYAECQYAVCCGAKNLIDQYILDTNAGKWLS